MDDDDMRTPSEMAADIVAEFARGLSDNEKAHLHNAIEEALRGYGTRMADGAVALCRA